MRFDICSTGQILHSSAKKSRALQLQFPLFESVSSQLVSQHLFLNFDSIRKYRFTRVKFRRGEKTIASNNAENVFFSPIVNFGRFHSWNRLDLLLSCSLFFFIFFILNRIYAGRVVISLNERERDRENPFHFSVLEKRDGASGSRSWEIGGEREEEDPFWNESRTPLYARSSTESSSLPFSSRFKW